MHRLAPQQANVQGASAAVKEAVSGIPTPPASSAAGSPSSLSSGADFRQRVVLLVLAAVVLLVGGLVQGLWTQRWRRSSALEAAAARLAELPTEFGGWSSEDLVRNPGVGSAGPQSAEEQEQQRERDELVKQLARVGAERWWVRRFRERRTNRMITVMLLCGRTAAMCAHLPEYCYTGAGYEKTGSDLFYSLRPSAASSGTLGDFRMSRFVKQDEVSDTQLLIFWSWLAGNEWQAPDRPRYSLAGQPYLYKLYVLRDGDYRPDKLENDPAVPFLRELIPLLTQRLAAEKP